LFQTKRLDLYKAAAHQVLSYSFNVSLFYAVLLNTGHGIVSAVRLSTQHKSPLCSDSADQFRALLRDLARGCESTRKGICS
jgi:hypothetical protein